MIQKKYKWKVAKATDIIKKKIESEISHDVFPLPFSDNLSLSRVRGRDRFSCLGTL